MVKYIYIIGLILVVTSCKKANKSAVTPWGSVVNGNVNLAKDIFSLDDIQSNGEIIMLTLSGPNTYYYYHGKEMGIQFRLAQDFARHLGVSLRVEVCRDTAELIKQIKEGEGDFIGCLLQHPIRNLISCGVYRIINNKKTSWAVLKNNKELAAKLNNWYKTNMWDNKLHLENMYFTLSSIKRVYHAPILNPKKGIISKYDSEFKKNAKIIKWDWRLLASQAYQESSFDEKAHSWAGACGIMQIMPNTARHLGLVITDIYNPKTNIKAAAKYLLELSMKFNDIPKRTERVKFVLASYNGGYYHIRDAMALASKYNKDCCQWNTVAEYVLKLRNPEFYQDKVVNYGFMRGDETVNYVKSIFSRWEDYKNIIPEDTSYNKFSNTPREEKKHTNTYL